TRPHGGNVNAIATESRTMRHEARPAVRVATGHRALGLCWVVYGILRLVMAVALAIGSGTATVMFGALLFRVADPYSLMTAFHILYLAFILFSGLLGIVGIVAGLALAGGTASARRMAIFASILAVSQVPIGTTLGIYTLLVLLPQSPRLSP